MKTPIYYIDLFAGAGGTTSGIERAGSTVVACVNHDANAIKSHAANHPNSLHLTEDIRDFKVVQKLKRLVDKMRKEEPNLILIIWASLECTNYSNAKGGKPRDADSRTLANDLILYLEALNPDYLQIENVREFMSWGPLDKNGKPIQKEKGIDYIKWKENIEARGYNYEHRIYNSADFGAHQSRVRFFGQFAKRHLPIGWPIPTHTKKQIQNNLWGTPDLKPWRAVREVLNLNDKGVSIFDRKKPLVEKTLQRILKGLEKFATKDKKDRKENVMLAAYYGKGGTHSVEAPCPTVPTKDRFLMLTTQFFDNQYGNSNATSIDTASGTITTNPKQALVSVERSFIENPQYNSAGCSLNKPSFTLIARMDKAPPYLITPLENQETNFTIIKDTDTPTMVAIKRFMQANGIKDILRRMLRESELLRIQGFPTEYKLIGRVEDRKKYIGNAVEVNMSTALATATRSVILKSKPTATAV